MDPQAVIEEIRQAGLRGRGGAGFPTAIKWETLLKDPAPVRYICCNGAEGEPGTFKDRQLLRMNPYVVLEGLAIAATVLGVERAYICLKSSFEREAGAVRRAMGELGAEGIGGNIELILGPDEYLYGEEKALLEVVEGGLPLPRVFPPYIHGLFSGAYGGPGEGLNNPTVVNNVETLAHAALIMRHGAEWFRSFGSDDTPGTMIFTVSGDVGTPIVRELPLGVSLRRLIDAARGASEGSVKAVLPGFANAVITADQLETRLSFDAMRRAGTALGSGGFIVYNGGACMARVAYLCSRFLFVESCNQCPPCKTGSRRITECLERLLAGEADRGDLEDIYATSTWVENGQRCYLPTSEAVVVSSILHAFPQDFEAHLKGTCALRHDYIIPKMTDYKAGSGFAYDKTYLRKLPDWSYAPRGRGSLFT
jgi:NADH-quinone oxidoreductase subunit F